MIIFFTAEDDVAEATRLQWDRSRGKCFACSTGVGGRWIPLVSHEMFRAPVMSDMM